MPLKTGDLAPDFDLAGPEGGIRLSAERGRPVVVWFHPRAGSATCTRQALDFAARAEDFARLGIALIGISPDDRKSQARFRAKHGLTLRLGSDFDHRIARAYDVWIEKSMYGRRFMGVERATFLIDPQGRIARIWRKVRLRGHVDEVLHAAASLSPAEAWQEIGRNQ